jgi:hypothetical protein
MNYHTDWAHLICGRPGSAGLFFKPKFQILWPGLKLACRSGGVEVGHWLGSIRVLD